MNISLLSGILPDYLTAMLHDTVRYRSVVTAMLINATYNLKRNKTDIKNRSMIKLN